MINKRYRKPKGNARMDNPKTLATLSIQDTGKDKLKQKRGSSQTAQNWVTKSHLLDRNNFRIFVISVSLCQCMYTSLNILYCLL